MTDVDFGLTELIPLALVIALSPLSIIPGILMPVTTRAGSNSSKIAKASSASAAVRTS